jgi:Sec-independent protein translocase protein TatA
MNILGVGGPEFFIILLLMLVVAGPKRMVKWAYIMGQYVAKFRRMWAETVDVLQHEFDEAGVDIQIPRDVPTRGSLRKEATRMVGTFTDPVKETLEQVNTGVGEITKVTTSAAQAATSTVRATNGHATTKSASKPAGSTAAPRKPPSSVKGDGFGAWSDHKSRPDFGSWTANGQQNDEE